MYGRGFYEAVGEENQVGRREWENGKRRGGPEVKEIFPSPLHLQISLGKEIKLKEMGLGKEIELRETFYTPALLTKRSNH